MSQLALLRDRAEWDVRRWHGELVSAERGTLISGMMKESLSYAEEILRQTVSAFFDPQSAEAQATLAEITGGKGKPLSKLTFGECVRLLANIDHRHLAYRQRLISPREKVLLDRLTRVRNSFTHERNGLDQAKRVEILNDVLALCSLQIVEAAALKRRD